MTLRKRLEALEQRQFSIVRRPTMGFFLPVDPPAEIEPTVIRNGYDREWRRLENETAKEFISRVKREAESTRDGMLGCYDRMLRVTESSKAWLRSKVH